MSTKYDTPEYSNAAFFRMVCGKEIIYSWNLNIAERYTETHDAVPVEVTRISGMWWYLLVPVGHNHATGLGWRGPFYSEEEAKIDCKSNYNVNPETGEDLGMGVMPANKFWLCFLTAITNNTDLDQELSNVCKKAGYTSIPWEDVIDKCPGDLVKVKELNLTKWITLMYEAGVLRQDKYCDYC
ncbi:MAG: hypothetical protein ACXAEU_21015 [Candidatus Hodarchaeales archaeon]|jgi:hypothetical protein